MENYEDAFVNQLTRIANGLETLNKREALLPRRFPANGENRGLTDEELYDWWGSFSQQKRDFLNGLVKNGIVASVADIIGPIPPEIARLIQNYI
ncbi:hypothetical protein [Lysinibacillus sp. TE18511]